MDEQYTCPTCGDSFGTENGMKVHHYKAHDKSISGVLIDCSWCGESHRKGRSEVQNNDNSFCSDECLSAWRSEQSSGENNPLYNRVSVECDNCGSLVEKRPSELDGVNHHFCDRDCFGEWHDGPEHDESNWVDVTCSWCSDQFQKLKSKANKTEYHFCDFKNCFQEWHDENMRGASSPRWKGGHEGYYGPNWEDIREEVLERDNYTCQKCGSGRDGEHRLEIHHIRPFIDFQTESGTDYQSANHRGNLITLCQKCHSTVENNPELLPR